MTKKYEEKERISIRAPARGATFFSHLFLKIRENFNPRSREGSDVGWASNGYSTAISIRAPARGATSIFAKKFSSLLAKIV